ncbi:DUF4962 domain-containing protein [Massilia arenosa]|uniref:DUF4962 domain-containing protein n=1 Tax=Zemynaea arenosa TaxID=2561931 RepID=A0A4Y9SJI6_9BURK|nr:heparinase II/III family protein [Massilia arenosa]TFW21152.1 DUF4962 domain-containing protein [Massilia arenosa]
MQSRLSGTMHTLLLSCLALSGAARADWVVSTQLEAVRPAPANFQVQPQNPPAFSWSRHSANPPGYVVEVRQNGSTVYTFTTDRNWYLPSKAFAPGHYQWRVRPSNSTAASAWSDLREFDIGTASAHFEVPDNAALKSAASARKRPRELPAGFSPSASWTADIKAERAKALATLKSEIDYKIPTMKAVRDADWPLVTAGVNTAAANSQNADVRTRINTSGRQLEGAALLYRLTLDRKYLNEAIARGDQLAALSPTGPTSYANQDQGTRVIALSLIKAADLLWSDLDSTRRAKWLATVATRTNAIYADLSGSNGRIDQYPFDSHGGTNLGFLAVISALAVGDIPDASKWFDFSVRAYINSVYAWSGPEGGFANGTAYAQYTADYALQIWQPLTQATGVNLFTKPWATGFLQFFAEFLPPGSTRHVFGDEHETAPDWRMMKAYASRFASPQAAWYANAITGDEDTLTLLQAPYPLPYKTAKGSTAPPNAALFPSIGWVAMHSSISDLGRTSLLFKSSPYGSYNHSHGDQNGFVLNADGQPLLIEAGYEDYYGSPLFKDWYRQSKAHNTITYDGGKGQLVDGNTINLGRNGRITAFSSTATLDYTEGDATAAYGSVVNSAVRRVWYLRSQDAYVIQDAIRAPAAHVWEWNVHTPTPMVQGAAASITVTNGTAKVCVRPLINDTAYQIRFGVRQGPAPKPGTAEYHGAWTTPSSTKGEFLMLVDVGCRKPNIKITDGSTTRTIVVGSQSISVPR